MSKKKVSYSVLSEVLLQKQNLNEFIKSKFNLTESAYEEVRVKVERFIESHNIKFNKQCHRKKTAFLKKHQAWLNRELVLCEGNNISSNGEDKQQSATKTVKVFNSCSESTKRRRCEAVRKNTSKSEIQKAFLGNLRKNNKTADIKIIELLEGASTLKKTRVIEMLKNDSLVAVAKRVIPYTADEAVALMVDGKLTKFQYTLFQRQAKGRNSNLYPPYHHVLESRKKCYPDENFIVITDINVNIDLQALLEHTAKRLLEALILDIPKGYECLIFYYKWGLDGASGQSLYKQLFNTQRKEQCSDSSILMISLVPLEIRTASSIVLWRNSQASSTKYCRPIKFEFTKETQETIKQQYKFVQDQIKELVSSSITFSGTDLRVEHKLEMTMVDGKVIDHLTDTSFSNCNICGAKPSQMNNINVLKELICDKNVYEFGLSTLHCWIRFLECCLHIAYRLPVKKWKPMGDEKTPVNQNKKRIQDVFKTEKGLLLDVVKQGAGTTNDGNTARRFFKDPEFSAEVTGLDGTLIKRFKTILIALSSGRDIDVEKFREYAWKTAKLYLNLYSWFYMPPSVHKILFHGADIINSLNLPIGLYSEEAQEARNKDFKRIRRDNTRKTSRLKTNEDLIHGLLISSDPVISSLRTTFPKKSVPFDKEVVQLFTVTSE